MNIFYILLYINKKYLIEQEVCDFFINRDYQIVVGRFFCVENSFKCNQGVFFQVDIEVVDEFIVCVFVRYNNKLILVILYVDFIIICFIFGFLN